jgi:hypothetical protein
LAESQYSSVIVGCALAAVAGANASAVPQRRAARNPPIFCAGGNDTILIPIRRITFLILDSLLIVAGTHPALAMG